MAYTLLIDADIVAYQSAASLETATEWQEGYWTWSVNEHEVRDSVLSYIETLKERFGTRRARLCLSDDTCNFRKEILPTYKHHRRDIKKPLVLLEIKRWLRENHKALTVPTLEGDDLLGLLATHPKTTEPLVVSLDKDLKTIPCKWVRTKAQFTPDGALLQDAWEIKEISEQEADYHWMYQTLTGDTTDGYGGCPSVGPKRAEQIISPESSLEENWEKVVETYEKKNLGEAEALIQARCARILRHGDYDYAKKELKLWQPSD